MRIQGEHYMVTTRDKASPVHTYRAARLEDVQQWARGFAHAGKLWSQPFDVYRVHADGNQTHVVRLHAGKMTGKPVAAKVKAALNDLCETVNWFSK